MILTSKSNPIIKKIASLKEKKFRKEHSLFLIEGEKMVKEAISSPLEIEDVIISEDYDGDTYSDNPIIVSSQVFKFIADEKTPQGIMALAKIPEYDKTDISGDCIILDGLQDPGNVGTIIRTANAAGYKDIYLLNCADPYSPKCVRSAMSGLFFVRIHTGNADDILARIKIPIISADMGGENIFSFSPPEKYALAIGNEGNGLSTEVKEKSSYTIKIPMDPTSESLNAGVSAGIAMYILKSRKFIEK